MRLIVANCTKQNFEFWYMVPEIGKLRKQHIPAGGQSYVHDDTTIEVITAIVDQHVKYGLIAVEEVNRAKAFIGQCFSIDKPIDVGSIMYAAEHNEGVLFDAAAERRKQAASAFAQSLMNQDLPVQQVDMEVVEQEQPGKEGARLAEGVSVRPDGRPARRSRPTLSADGW